MANTKISELTAATSLAGTELVPVVQAGATKSATVQQIANKATGFAATAHTHTASEVTDFVSAVGALAKQSFVIACSDESTAITVGTAKVTFRVPYAFTLTGVRASLTTASSSGAVTVDVNEGGVSIFGTNKLTIDASEKTSTTAATAPDLSDTTLADDAEITIDVDGAGTGAKGLKVALIGRPA